jgi:hypothetical protein
LYRNFFPLAEIDFISPLTPSARSLNFRYYTVYGLDFILSLVLSDLMIEWGGWDCGSDKEGKLKREVVQGSFEGL